MSELTQIKGIGLKTAEALAALPIPITTLSDLVAVRIDVLASLLDGVTAGQAKEWQTQAEEILTGLGTGAARIIAQGDPKTEVPERCVNCLRAGTVELNKVFVCSACGFRWPVGWREGV